MRVTSSAKLRAPPSCRWRKFLDLAFEFGNRLFEIEKGRHGPKNGDHCRKFNRRRKQIWLSAHGVSGFLYESVKRFFFRQGFEKGDEIGPFVRAQVQAAQNPFTSGVQPFLVDCRIVAGDVGERLEAAGMHVGRGERHVAQARHPNSPKLLWRRRT